LARDDALPRHELESGAGGSFIKGAAVKVGTSVHR
jgi:hypothetical protein